MSTPTVSCADAFSRHVAESLHPTQLRELLFTAASRGIPPPGWSAFARDLERRSLRRRPGPVSASHALAEVLADPSVRDRTKAFLRAAREADPVDAVQDAALIEWLMRERLNEVIDGCGSPIFGAAEDRDPQRRP